MESWAQDLSRYMAEQDRYDSSFFCKTITVLFECQEGETVCNVQAEVYVEADINYVDGERQPVYEEDLKCVKIEACQVMEVVEIENGYNYDADVFCQNCMKYANRDLASAKDYPELIEAVLDEIENNI